MEQVLRSAEQAVRSADGEPYSSERLARFAEWEPGSLTTEVPDEVHSGGRMGRAPLFFFIGSGAQDPTGEAFSKQVPG